MLKKNAFLFLFLVGGRWGGMHGIFLPSMCFFVIIVDFWFFFFFVIIVDFCFFFFQKERKLHWIIVKVIYFFFNWNSQDYWDRPLNTLRMDREFCTERRVFQCFSACFCLSENTFSLEEFFDEQKYYLLLHWDEEEYMWCCHWSENSY